MDFEDALKAGGASAGMISILGIAIKLVQKFCGNRVRSECCGKEGTVGVAVEPMTPREQRPSVGTPAPLVDTVVLSMKDVKTPTPSCKATPELSAAPATDAPPPPPLEV